jgi:hypothetical protein
MIKSMLYSIIITTMMYVLCHTFDTNFVFADAPKFESQFADYLLNKDQNLIEQISNGNMDKQDNQETLFDPELLGIDRNKWIKANMINLFYPQSYQDSGRMRELIKNIIIVLMIVWMFFAGMDLLIHANDANKVKDILLKIWYIVFWWLICFISWWLLAQLGIRWWENNIQWSAWIFQWIQWQYNGDEWVWLYNQTSGILFDILNTIKAAAFFIAIVMIAWYWFQIIRGMDEADKIESAKKWITNIVIALVVIRVIDFVYYIAQSPSFNSQAMNAIVSISKYVWYILWALFVIVLIYSWIKVIFSNWDDQQITKAKNYITTMFLIGITILLFLLIIYQVIQEVI